MPNCLYPNCKTMSGRMRGARVKLHAFPIDRIIQAKWIQSLGITEQVVISKGRQNCKVCSLHFDKEDLVPFGKSVKLKYTAVPKKRERGETTQRNDKRNGEASSFKQENRRSPEMVYVDEFLTSTNYTAESSIPTDSTSTEIASSSGATLSRRSNDTCVATELKFIVSAGSIKQLLRFCPNCGSRVASTEDSVDGTCLIVKTNCSNQCNFEWRSQTTT